jgi:hypothetical protein
VTGAGPPTALMTCATRSCPADVAATAFAVQLDPKTLSGRTPSGGTPSTMMSPSPVAGSRTEITLGAPSPVGTSQPHLHCVEVAMT